MAGETTRPHDATRWIATSRGLLSYAQLAPLLGLPPVELAPARPADIESYLATLRACDAGNLQPLAALWQDRLAHTG